MGISKEFLDGVSETRDSQTYKIIGAAMEVHGQLGRGFSEPVYQEATVVELGLQQVPFTRETPLPIQYKGTVLPCSYRADFICYERVIVELKALPQLTGVERAQVINYLKATGYRVALLINFGGERLEYERIVFG